MKSGIILVVLCVTITGFNRFPEIRRSALEIPMKDHSASTTTGLLPDRECMTDSTEPWTAKQLMAPADLATMINDSNVKKPVIICVGPGALIKGSLDMGPAKEKANLERLKQQLNKLPRDENIVIYCGCCPFEHCPNIRPAFILIKEMKFTNAHLLNLEHNIKTDWIAKGYPAKA